MFPCLAPTGCPHLASSVAGDGMFLVSLMAALSSAHTLLFFTGADRSNIFSTFKRRKSVYSEVSFLTPVSQPQDSRPQRQPIIAASHIFLHRHIMHKHAYVHKFSPAHAPSFSPQEWQRSTYIKTYLAFFTEIYVEGPSCQYITKFCPFFQLYSILLHRCTRLILSSPFGCVFRLLSILCYCRQCCT